MVEKHPKLVYRRQTMWNVEGAETDFPTAVINDKQVQAGQMGVAVGMWRCRGFSISQLLGWYWKLLPAKLSKCCPASMCVRVCVFSHSCIIYAGHHSCVSVCVWAMYVPRTATTAAPAPVTRNQDSGSWIQRPVPRIQNPEPRTQNPASTLGPCVRIYIYSMYIL